MATGCAVSPAFTFHNRKTRATSPSPSSTCRTGWPCIKYHPVPLHARTRPGMHAGMRVPAARARGRSELVRFYYRESTGVARQRHARARACVSESGARRRTTHVCALTPARREYAPIILTSRRRRRAGLFKGLHCLVVSRTFYRTRLLSRLNRLGLILGLYTPFVTSSFNVRFAPLKG